MSDFSKNLKELRMEKGLSQQELAQIFNVTQSTVANGKVEIENLIFQF